MKKSKSYFNNMNKDESLYYDKLNELKDCEFSDIRNIATIVRNRFPLDQQDQWAKEIDRGKGLIEDHYQACEYLFRYGPMHQEKLLNSFNELRDEDLDNEIEVIDWGCGQGIGSMCLHDYLKRKNFHSNIKKFTLIDPSEYIVNRAEKHVKCFVKSSLEIVKLSCYFDEIIKSDLIQSPQRIIIHIFSNVLDIEKVDLDIVSSLIKSLGESENFIVCTSPNWNEKVQIRFDYFFNSFEEKSRFIYKQKNTERVYAGNRSEVKSLSDNTLIFSYNTNYINSVLKKSINKIPPKSDKNLNYRILITIVFCALISSTYFYFEKNKVELFKGLNSVPKTEIDLQMNSSIIDENFIDNYMTDSSFIIDSSSVDTISVNQTNNIGENQSSELLGDNLKMIEIINFIKMSGESDVKLIREKILQEYNIKLKKREVSRFIDIVEKFNEN